MSTPNTKAVVSAFCLSLLASGAFAQGQMTNAPARGADQATQSAANPAAQPVQGGATGMARNPDTTSPATRDPMLSGGQTTDGRSPGTTSGTERASRPESSASTTAAGAGSVGAPHASGTRNDTTGGTTITNAPVGAAMDGSAGGQAAARNDSDRGALTGDGRTNIAPAGTGTAGQRPGANSFTEGQARSRMQDAGFAQVEGLRLDGNGVWRGNAMREGRQVEVSMDFQGTVTHR